MLFWCKGRGGGRKTALSSRANNAMTADDSSLRLVLNKKMRFLSKQTYGREEEAHERLFILKTDKESNL